MFEDSLLLISKGWKKSFHPLLEVIARMEPDNFTIKELKNHLKQINVNENIIELLTKDSRKGVQKLAKKYKNILIKKRKIKQKWKSMNKKENRLRNNGYKSISGVDEAGRGPLAGPVVAAAVILDKNKQLPGLDDSKKLSNKKRKKLFKKINEKAKAVGIGKVSSNKIDKINIHNASFLAMKRALTDLNIKPDYILVDGNKKISGIQLKQEAVINGDARVNCISAASIIAKVTRDNIIESCHSQFPEYNFKNNKGYGTKEHIKAINKYGPSPVHRYSYKIVNKNA